MTARRPRASRTAAARARSDRERTDDAPSIAEIAALTGRLAHLSSGAATADERAQFLADKAALLDRITRANRKD